VRDLFQQKVELWARNGRSSLAYSAISMGIVGGYFFLPATKLRHGTDGFTSLPKEGLLRIFLPEKSDSFSQV
jgi:hypothetical protein